MLKKLILLAGINCLAIYQLNAQSAHLDIDGNAQQLADRLITLSGAFPDNLHLTTQPLDAKGISNFLEKAQQFNTKKGWSSIDNFDISIVKSNVGEWVQPDGMGAIDSKNPVGPFYKKVTDMVYFNNRKLFLSINPVLGFQALNENVEGTNSFKYNFAAGAKIRAKYKDWLGLDLNVRYIQEQPVSYYNELYSSRNTIVGSNYHTLYNAQTQTYGYVLPTGSISASVLKDYISVDLGYDYLKMGDGHRSLILSNFSSPVGYANIRTKIWKLQYDNLFLRLSPDNNIPFNTLSNNTPNYKFATAHQLSVNVTKWLNIGAYEMVVFNRDNNFELGYLNPIIFYRAIERSLGSPDKVAIGLNAKAIASKGFQIYGQFMLNEFTASEFFASNGYMHNKWGAQLGIKYFDVFNISNLDLQIEGNVTRPYTFQHLDRGNGYIASNFTNNNLPIGHPLGAGFREAIAIVKYRPTHRIALEAKAMIYQRGIDTAGLNLGNDLSKSYGQNVPSTFGVKMVNGPKLNRMLLSLNGSYLIAPNLYFDLGGVYGNFKYAESLSNLNNSHFHIYSGVRLNLPNRNYTQF